MSSDNNNLEISRRRILAGMGAVGAAGAGAGLGTSALFNDTESFENNQLTAGQLDLKVDWEEHYSYPQIYDLPDPEDGADVLREEPSNPGNYTPLPDPADPVVWVHDDDFDQYFGDTIIEAFPDAEGDPIEADFSEDPGGGQPCEVLADVPPDLGTYTDATNVDLGRTRNGDTYDSDSDESLPLISLSDVKPGDFGELTLSTHLCFNDGFLWLSMPDGLTETGGTTAEPEPTPDNGELAENIQTALWYDDDCSNTIDGEPDPLIAIALLDTSSSIDSSDMQTIADGSNAFVKQLNNQAETEVAAGVMTFSDVDQEPGGGRPSIVLQNDVEKLEEGGAYLDSNGDGKFDPGNNLLPSEGDGGTPIAPALDLARELLNDRAETLINQSGNGFGPNTRKSILVLTDGLPNRGPVRERYALVDPDGDDVQAENGTGVTNASDGQFLSDVFDGSVDGDSQTSTIQDEAALVARDIDEGGKSDAGPSGTFSPPEDPDISGENGITLRTVGVGTQNMSDLNDFLTRVATNDGFFYNVAGLSGPDLVNTVDDIVGDLNVTGPAEKVIFRGTLDELATQLDPNQQGPIPLDGMTMNNTIDETDADPSVGPADGRNCFDASSTHCFGFAWWVPRSVGNVIQGDTVEFDLQFLAEQCRNNDDPGQTVL